MSVNDLGRQTDTLADRLKTFREALGHNATEMAAEVALLVGTRTTYRRIGEWERGQVTPEPATIAAIALIHPISPRACLEWLRDGGKMPRIHEDRDFGGGTDPGQGTPEQKPLKVDMERIKKMIRGLLDVANEEKCPGQVLRHITEILEALEEQQEEAANWVPTLLNTGMWGISIDYIIQWISPELAHFMGHEVDDLLGKDFRDFVYPQDLPKAVSSVESRSSNTFRQRIKTPLGPQEVDITPVWADYRGKKARFTHIVPVEVPAER